MSLTDAEVELIRDAVSIQKMAEHKNVEMVTYQEGRTRVIGKGENQRDEAGGSSAYTLGLITYKSCWRKSIKPCSSVFCLLKKFPTRRVLYEENALIVFANVWLEAGLC